MDKIQFADKVAAEKLATDKYEEVITKKNFYFAVDETKKEKNLKIHNINAPGNKHRHPSHVWPHNHTSVLHPIDVDGNDQDHLMEIYGYYAFLIDLHIAQIRPDNLEEFSYVPKRFLQVNHLCGDLGGDRQKM